MNICSSKRHFFNFYITVHSHATLGHLTTVVRSKANVRQATKLSNFIMQLWCSTKSPRQLSIFHRQTIAKHGF